MRPVFGRLLEQVDARVAGCEVVSLPCCIHLAAADDFLAVLPRQRHLELRFSLRRQLDDPRVVRAARISSTTTKHRVDVASEEDVDEQLLSWIAEASQLVER
jgi:hypothetical protein